jgi:hypothetical protein
MKEITTQASSACGRAHRWMCGDHYVERHIPGFFSDHERSDGTFEWQVCVLCGESKRVLLRDALSRKMSEASKKRWSAEGARGSARS